MYSSPRKTGNNSLLGINIYHSVRPQVGFNVELLDAIDIDAFGIDTIITNVLDDVLAKRELIITTYAHKYIS